MKKNIVLILLAIICCIFGIKYYHTYNELKSKNELIETEFIDENGKYVSVNMSKEIDELKKENKALYDSLKNQKKDIEYVIQYKYVKQYVTDTVFIKPITDDVKTFVYENEKTDSINYKLMLGSVVEPNWYKLDLTVSDKFTIVNRKDGEVNKTTIDSENNGSITDVTIINTKDRKFIDHFSHGITVGAGYGVINQKVDVFVGYGLTYHF